MTGVKVEHSNPQLEYWTGGTGAKLLALVQDCYAQSGGDRAATILRLKSQSDSLVSSEEYVIALQIVQGRKQLATAGLAWASEGLFLDKQLQQGTSPILAAHHGYPYAGCECVADICCGLGFDSAGISQYARHVVAIEMDPLVAAFAHHNLTVQGVSNCTVYCMDAETFLESELFTQCDGIWVDPDRRSAQGQRSHIGSEYAPPVNQFADLSYTGIIGLKVSPLFDPRVAEGIFSREIVGCNKECKELLLWRNRDMPELSVSVIDEEITWAYEAGTEELDSIAVLEAGCYLVEPHNAFRQSGKLHAFLSSIQVAPLKGVPLGLAHSIPDYPGLAVFQIEAVHAFRPKAINRLLREYRLHPQTVIKKCGVSESAEQIRASLRFSDPTNSVSDYTLFVIGLAGKKLAVFCKRVSRASL